MIRSMGRQATTASRHDRERGFSLSELLVVIAILFILSAIAVPLYMAQRQKASYASIETAVRNVAHQVSVNADEYQLRDPELFRTALTEAGLAGKVSSAAPAFTLAYCVYGDGRWAVAGWSAATSSGPDRRPIPYVLSDGDLTPRSQPHDAAGAGGNTINRICNQGSPGTPVVTSIWAHNLLAP